MPKLGYDLIPDNPNKPYDMHEVIQRVVDEGRFLEVHRHYAQNILVGFARLGGRSVGIIAQQPQVLAGVLDINASTKGGPLCALLRRLQYPHRSPSRMCPASCLAWLRNMAGIIRNGAKLLYAYCEATVPKITVITRKAYGGAYCVMNSKHIRGDLVLAWPTAEIAVMGPEGAVNIIYRRQLAAAEDPVAERARLVAEYREKFANPYVAASRGYIDDVIEPRENPPAADQRPGDATQQTGYQPLEETRQHSPLT